LVFVSPLPAPPSPAQTQGNADCSSAATLEYQFHWPKHIAKLADGATHTSSPSSLSHKSFSLTIARLLQFSSDVQLQAVISGMKMIFST
jgi:hypothetical protein